jgi:hypothetical protein
MATSHLRLIDAGNTNVASLHDGGTAMKTIVSVFVVLIALPVLVGVETTSASALDTHGLSGKTSLEQQDRLAY